jgi:glutathione S-transferase
MSPLLLKLVFDRIETAKMPFFAKPIAKAIAAKAKGAFINPNIAGHLSFMEPNSARANGSPATSSAAPTSR